MAVYTIQDTTLRDIADAIRDKKDEVLEIEYQMVNSVVNTSFNIVEGKTYRLILIPSELIADGEGQLEFTTQTAAANYVGYFGSGITKYVVGEPTELIFTAPYDGILFQIVNITKKGTDSKIVSAIVKLAEIKEDGSLVNAYKPTEMAKAINEFKVIPEEALTITDTFNYRFSNDNWDWFINNYGHLITTNEISNLNYAFTSSKNLKSIPFDLNVSSTCSAFSNCFSHCYKLEEVPRIIGSLSFTNLTSSNAPSFDSMFEYCWCIRELPDDYFTSLAPHEVWTSIMSSTYGNRDSIFSSCYSLRKLPDISKLVNQRSNNSTNFYYYTFYNCYCLDEVINLPLNAAQLTGTGFSASSNMFYSTFYNCGRLKNITFEMNPENGNPLPAYWNKQTISLTSVGWQVYSVTAVTNYNSGITEDKKVTDDASYQALKNDPDWWTANMDYSRYNRASAVATINSLPDTSERGGANTITFKGAAGSKTDAGAISDLSEEEIAVAAAKGWTVTFA